MKSLFDKKQPKRIRIVSLRMLNLFASLIILILVWSVTAHGFGSIPPLGSTFNPLVGVWNGERNAQMPHTETLHFSGLSHPVTVVFEQNGMVHIQSQTDADLFWTMGYVQAHFRLFQMDLLRRQGGGLLSEILGPQALSSDRFEDTLGLANTARTTWDELSPSNAARQTLTSYSQGVNASIAQQEQEHTLPAMFTLLNYQPQTWTPIDSIIVEGVMTQTLSLSNIPLDYALLANTLGYQRTMQWFPVVPPDDQKPYDTSTHSLSGAAPLPTQSAISAQDIQNLESVESMLADLPTNAIRHDSDSNSWAINGSKSATGQSLLAGDPHLNLSLPSIWFQVEGNSPNYSFNGVTIPGLPIILIGKNKNISWSITDAQTQTTLFYLEKTDSAHPNQYYWDGSWRQMKQVSYTIPVKGKPAVHFEVKQTIHGPIISQNQLPGKPVSIEWMGNIPSSGIDEMLKLVQATNFSQFKDALRGWVAPALNFVYADNQNNIGIVAPGAYPIVKSGTPWLPLSGTGESDIVGTIPFNDLPQAYDPPSHFVSTANQRPVSNNYPYYIGTTQYFDNGYRADEIDQQLSSGDHLTTQDMEKLQNSTQDYLANLIIPKLLATLKTHNLSSQEKEAYTILSSWDKNMQMNTVAPSIWWTFWNQYLVETFQPWWQAQKVPADRFPELNVDAGHFSLDEDLETWTLKDPENSAFTLPTGEKRTASDVMFLAFQNTLSSLSKKLGNTMQGWQWGKLNVRKIPSLTGINALGYGPIPSDGDNWTINAADTHASIHGPSWRMIVNWGSGGQSEGIYPAGQSEDPLSDWYQNGILPWLHGQYYPLVTANELSQNQKEAIWTIQP